MDTTDPAIQFDESGNCNHCTEFLDKRAKYKYRGEESDRALKQVIEDMKATGKGREYDCIVGLSGGVDSCYAAYLLKQNGLRVLAVHLDNGWNSEEAVQNIKSVAQKLDIDYESYVLDWEEFKNLQLSFLKASVPEAETPTDIAILASVHHFASKYKVKYIVSGGNFATEGILPKYWHYDAKDKKYLTSIQKKFGTVRLKKFPTFGFNKEMIHKVVKRTKIIYLLNYVDYKKDETMEFLKKELDWKYYGGKHYESKYTGFIQSYYLVKKFDLDYRRATLSSQICTGDVTRDEALEILKISSYASIDVEKEKAYLAKKLGISLAEFQAIIDLPPKWYTDYPNNEKKLAFVYNTYRKLFKKEKLGSF
ncbi:MAG: N-acetyl sugar amidotransferase [Crocinitomicaceae bacterium]|jgi:N-acetyl sugar amidotransferase